MKIITIIIAILFILALVFVGTTYSENQKVKQDNQRINQFFNNALGAINEIEENLTDLKIRESIAQRLSFNNSEYPDFIIQDQKQQIILSIKEIDDYIAYNKNRLSLLEKQLEDNNINISSLQRMIDNLKKIISDRESIIAELQLQIDDLTNILEDERRRAEFEISLRDETITTQSGIISTQDELLKKNMIEDHTVYFFIATKDELIKNNFLTKPGLLSSAKLTNSYNREIMNSVNMLEYQDIIIPAELKKIKILSTQDVSSYEMISYGAETLFKIIDIEQFKKVKYLIVQI